MKFIRFLMAIFFSIALAACGGGGGSSTPAATYSISGTVTGAANVTLALSGASTATATTDASGNYSFAGLANGSYTVTPTKTGFAFNPTSTAVSVSGANVTEKNSVATASAATTYCLSGTVSGAVMQNVTIFLNGANTGSTVTDANGNYTFCGLVSGNYTVTALLQGYSITTSSTITIGAANPASVNLTSTVATGGNSVIFVPLNPLPQATVGIAYSNSVISSISGGTSPYHYQSDTFANGAPPMGLIVDLSGNLTGTPSAAGTYTFGVCAVDMVGSSSCKSTSIIVNPALVVSLAGTGSGSVTSSPAGISCGATCSAGFASGTSVTLTATPSTGSTFTGWSGACSGTGSCVVTKTATTQTVTATFTTQGVTGTWNGSFVWPGANYSGCSSTTLYPSISLTQNGSSVTGTWDSATYSGPINGNTMTITGVSPIFGTGTAQTWTWNGANTIQAVVGYGCYDLNTGATLQHGYYPVVLTR
ncbi:MAG TPA: carboxypeptidase regulatory-like domain-containing protein [Rhodoferax sp.]